MRICYGAPVARNWAVRTQYRHDLVAASGKESGQTCGGSQGHNLMVLRPG